MSLSREAVLLGAGGHAKVVLSLAQAAGWTVTAVLDPALARAGQTCWRGLPVHDDDVLQRTGPARLDLLNGVGQTVGDDARRKLFQRCIVLGHRFPALVHPQACVDPTAVLDSGVQVMAGAVIQADVSIGADTIVNTLVGIDHDCRIGSHVHLAPRAVLCGGVQVEDRCFVGAGAIVLPGLRLGAASLADAGATVTADVPAGRRWARASGRLLDARVALADVAGALS